MQPSHVTGVLEKVTPNDVGNDAFPFYTWQRIEIGMAKVYAMRISYVGELGWEIHMTPDVALAVYDDIFAAGQEYNITPVGLGAMRNMRVEKGYRVWGADINTEYNPFEAGMSWLVKLKKKSDFIGKAALSELKTQALERRLITLAIDDVNAVVTGNEPVFYQGECISYITSAGHAYSLGCIVAFAYVPIAQAVQGVELEVEYLGGRYVARVIQDVPFDPDNEGMRG